MAPILIGDDILLRTYQAEDAPELFRAVTESRRHLRTWLDWVDKTTKPEHSLQFIQQSLDQLHNQQGLAMGIFHKDNIIGSIGMHNWEHALKKAQVGYWISQAHEGKGIVSKCLIHFTSFLFANVGLNKIEIHYEATNKRSAKVAERLGFKTEGYIRQSILRNGMPADVVIAGLLKCEWKDSGGGQ